MKVSGLKVMKQNFSHLYASVPRGLETTILCLSSCVFRCLDPYTKFLSALFLFSLMISLIRYLFKPNLMEGGALLCQAGTSINEMQGNHLGEERVFVITGSILDTG